MTKISFSTLFLGAMNRARNESPIPPTAAATVVVSLSEACDFLPKLDKHRGKDLIPVRARSVSFHNCGVIEFLLEGGGVLTLEGLRHGKRERGKNKV